MSQSSVLIIGQNRIAAELEQLCREHGLTGVLSSDAKKAPSSTVLAVDTVVGGAEEKKSIIRELDKSLPSSAIILTSCLGFSTTEIASWSGRPGKVVGFATFFPLKDKGIIELAKGLKTEESSLRQAEDFIHQLGKETEWVKDAPGLVFPRILSLIINEAARSLDEGVAVAEDIDVALRLGTNYPLGPLRWADQVGVDEVLNVLEGLLRETGDDRYRPSPLLRKMVLAGHLGEVSGQGFYRYDK
ncbi:MAG: 3-hydroxybutyryl-CoA dehydrogenase [Deltaproteobacteria bacterium]|nr:3-hydroxybutyryl-CoA dehydrogenase [Deltaproteobacteria bacterium]